MANAVFFSICSDSIYPDIYRFVENNLNIFVVNLCYNLYQQQELYFDVIAIISY